MRRLEGLLDPDTVKAVQKNSKMTEEFLLEEIKAVKAAKERWPKNKSGQNFKW